MMNNKHHHQIFRIVVIVILMGVYSTIFSLDLGWKYVSAFPSQYVTVSGTPVKGNEQCAQLLSFANQHIIQAILRLTEGNDTEALNQLSLAQGLLDRVLDRQGC